MIKVKENVRIIMEYNLRVSPEKFSLYRTRQTIKKTINKNKDILVFLEKPFDIIERKDAWKSLQNRGIQQKIIEVINVMYRGTENEEF